MINVLSVTNDSGRRVKSRRQSLRTCATSCTVVPTAICRRVQSLSCGYATSTPQCHMHLVSYIALSDSPLPEIFVPSLNGDINAQSSNCNNGKMKIAYNSAYVQIETFNFTFPSKPLLCISIFVPTSVLCRTRNINDYFFANNVGLYINREQTINKLQALTYTELLFLLVILVQTCRISKETGMHAQNLARAMLHLPTD